MGGVGMAQRRHGHAHCGEPGARCGGAAGARATGATHGGSRRGTWGVIPSGGGQAPGRVARGLPGGAEQGQGLCGEGPIPVFGALAAVDLDLETWASDVGALQEEGVGASESQARDGGAGDWVVQGRRGRQEALDLLHTEDGGEPVGGVRPQARQRGPVALEHMRIAAADPTGAEAHGRWGEASDVFAVQAGVLQLLCRDAVRGWVGALREQADRTDLGVLGTLSLTTALESRAHVLTQWGHERSPFVRCVVRLRRKTS
jgi:hypothetical protein